MEWLKNAKLKNPNTERSNNMKSEKELLFERLIAFAKNFGKSIEPYLPDTIVFRLRDCFPQFKSTYASTKQYMQQDAEECMNALFTVLNECSDRKIIDETFSFKIVNKIRRLNEKELEDLEQNNEGKKEIVEIKRHKKDSEENKKETELKNTAEPTQVKGQETESEESIETSEEFHTKLCCHMGNQRRPINHMHEGIKLSFKEIIEKFSEEHGKNMLYEKVSEIDSLPPYLIVHFVRFEWIKIVEGNKTTSDRAKICRKVNFSQTFDLYDFCSDKIKSELKISRNIILKRKEKEVLEANKKIESMKEEKEKKENTTEEKKEEVKEEIKEEIKETVLKEEPKKIELFTGNYKLLSVVTHKGRYAEGGHYIAWRSLKEEDEQKEKEKEEQKNQDALYNVEVSNGLRRKKKTHDPTWLKLDDDKVSSHKFSQIDLTGGRSDYHIAILLMFKRESIFCTQEEIDEASK